MLARGRISPVSIIDSVQPSRAVSAGQREMPQPWKHKYPLQVFAKASVKKALISWCESFPFLFLDCSFLTAGSYCCCLQNCDKMFCDFLSACSTNCLKHCYLCNEGNSWHMFYRVKLFSCNLTVLQSINVCERCSPMLCVSFV